MLATQHHKKFKVVTTAALFGLFACGVWAGGSDTTAKSDELNQAAQTMQQMTSSTEIPKTLMDQANCIGVIPKLTKGGFIAGAEHGSGVVSCRTGNGWSAPAFFSISGGSVGFQAGLENSQIVLLMNDKGKQYVMNDNFQLGAEAVAAGPTSGTSGSVGWKAPILSYAKSKGAYAGVNLAGSTIKLDNDSIHKVYGSDVSAEQVLNASVQPPADARPFISALPATHGM